MAPMKKSASVSEKERHLENVATLLFHRGKLYSGADDGKIKMWSSDLKLEAEVQAHPVNVYSLAAEGDTLYSSSNDGSIRSWNILDNLKPGLVVKEDCDVETMKLKYANDQLYGGDVDGMVTVYKGAKKVKQYEILEEVGDMEVLDNLLYTCRDTYVTITEMLGKKSGFTMRKSMQGRSPLAVSERRLVFTSTDGRCIQIHENNKENNFEEVAGVPAHEMIIQAMCISKDGRYVFTGGYDRCVRRWDLDTPRESGVTGEFNTEPVVSSLCAGEKGQIYVGGTAGYLVRVEAA
ncbi:myosin heavy chain kinase B [Thrips palmi]|uniref:Myosin heavy chain kinase B n=1 Tax=Thrips palmi TaxID=161013 RepID=A0A6P8ZYE1_THRPL|nr:myosin heavy chain kinase B [Thrips palmi]